KTFTQLPNLEQFSDQVTIIEAKENKKDFDKNSPLLLGVDVGSTTTKAVLVDPIDDAVVASYYGRTSGNPIEATRKCINEIIDQVGNCKINLVGVTGSGRQIVAAYLGTSAVYNEISAHSEGAVYFDKEVDTIFEIGGQDSKYMFLQNGVPVDYAMNASCSAGTGSFLEESSKGDLGINVFDISDVAMKADSPVRFKADCAAFINTDIRTAAQEGYEPDNIVGGLVYSIADNYLNKVKGLRPVGKKIFFQGGVAKNNAVGYAFAQTTGKQIIIPPNPELVGAFGISLIARTKYEQHEINAMPKQTTLKTLIKEEMNHLGNFTCKSCTNYCQIERYEVGGRKFPFGGRCSKYEHQWRGSDKTEEKEDLVLIRNDLLFKINSETEKKAITQTEKIGIPRALLTHTLYPLFSTFFEELGYEVVLSGIDDDKELMTNASFCYPVQILHGAVLDLIKNDVTTIFLPHVHSGSAGENWANSTFCPLTQASPYFISQAFREAQLLSPVLDFRHGYEKNVSLIDIAVDKLNQPKNLAKKAYTAAVNAQKQMENKFLELGTETLDKLKESGEIGIILVGRSYNAFPAETSQSIPKKLASMGVTVIPFDFLDKDSAEDMPWFFANYAQKALELVKEYDNLFLLYINSFSCTIDAFVQNHVRNEMDTKPYLILELDSHTADAGTQTRLEAFLEIIKNFQVSKKKEEDKPFQVAKVKKRNGKIVVINSDNRKVDIRDPRVKLHFFPFSQYHTDMMTKVFDLFGFHTGETTEMILDYPVKGLRYTSGKECLPLPIVIGHIQSVLENRKPGELVGFFMIRGGAPCAVYSYFNYLQHFIEKNQLKDVFLYRFDQLTDFLGMDRITVARFAPATALLGDLMVEIDSALQVVGNNGSRKMLHDYWLEFLSSTNELKYFHKNVKKLVTKISTIPRRENPKDLPKVLISGDFFVRFSPFFLGELKELYAKHGILVKSTDLYELTLYGNINLRLIVSQKWKRDPYKFTTTLKA
ncbi:MAG: acyl-CoA dehydratase activase-related protein, partial [Candidatus Heimdallarchaeaceae archaeon]